MTIIELLNKIANGEEVPKKIKVKGFFELERTSSNSFLEYYIDEHGGFLFKNYSYELNENIEILEEEKKIEKLDELIEIKSEDKIGSLIYEIQCIEAKLNQVIDEINKLKEDK